MRLLLQNNGHTDEISLQQFIHHTSLSSTLLGAPLLKGPSMNDCLQKRRSNFERAISRLELFALHRALVLCRTSFSAPALQHTLRASPSNGREALTQFDNLLRIAFIRCVTYHLRIINGYKPAYLSNLADWTLSP